MRLYQIWMSNDFDDACEEVVVLIVARNKEEARQKALEKHREKNSIDWIEEVKVIDGYEISLKPQNH